ncbi:hypothetical protein [Azospirillum largimobile]
MEAKTVAPDNRIGRTPEPEAMLQASCRDGLLAVEQFAWQNTTEGRSPPAEFVAKCVRKRMAGAADGAN